VRTVEKECAMQRRLFRSAGRAIVVAAFLSLLSPGGGHAAIDGTAVTSNVPVALTAKAGHIQTVDAASHLMWSYAPGGTFQYPGPTLIVNQGDTVVIELTNELDVPTSIVFPGQQGVTATGDQAGLLTAEAAAAGGTASYSFVASEAGTYLYHSGTQPELQIEMGLVGAIVVRPTGFVPGTPKAYSHVDSSYDREFLFLLTEMDAVLHDAIEFQGLAELNSADYFSGSFPVYWFINGRAAPDTLVDSGDPLLPNQPYGSLVLMHPGDRVLMRVVGGGKDLHPFHHHGNHARVIARNGRLLESTAGAGADLAVDVFTIQSIPGETADAIFTWTGQDLGWDIYGTGPQFAHACTSASCPDIAPINGFHDVTGAPCFDDTTKEYCPDHGKALPVTLPGVQDLALGPFWGGSPFMGVNGFLPPDFVSFNPDAGFTFMFHSHTERELTNFDVFPGGMMTMALVLPHSATIP
jgi:hypothetical protein